MRKTKQSIIKYNLSMERISLLLFVWMAIAVLPSFAEKQTTKCEVHEYTSSDNSKNRPRMPLLRPDIDVIYDEDAHTIEFVYSFFCDVKVYVKDEYGNIIHISYSMDEIINLPVNCKGKILIILESQTWYAIAEVPI